MYGVFDGSFEDQVNDSSSDNKASNDSSAASNSRISSVKSEDNVEIFAVNNDLTTPWQLDGLCAETDPEIFFPVQNSSTIKQARRICDLCSVSVDCLNYALSRNIRSGIWGGVTENERRKIKKANNQKQKDSKSATGTNDGSISDSATGTWGA